MNSPGCAALRNESRFNMIRMTVIMAVLAAMILSVEASARVCNIRVVSDNRPDFTDMQSLVRSVTASYKETDAQCKAMWRWITRCRRQTPHSLLHGTPPHDPIMFFNDFGYSFCSDYAGLNCAIWHEMGLPVRYWDVAAHTVSECYYDGRWHMFDNSMSAYYTLCDGKTVAGVEDIGKEGACEASGGKAEKAHAALVHCVGATSPYGFLTGADTQRALQYEGVHCFNPNALKYRDYFNGFELGHRYVLNLRANETYTRYARPLGDTADYYLPLENGKSPQKLGTFGNGEWVFRPDLKKPEVLNDLYRYANVAVTENGLAVKDAGKPAEAVFRINAANIVTNAKAIFDVGISAETDSCVLAVSTDHGRSWEVFGTAASEKSRAEIAVPGVAGTYQYIVKATLAGKALLKAAEFRTVTQLNKLTLPVLDLGRNTIDVVAGDPTETILVWPELQNTAFRESCYASENVASGEAADWHGCLWLEKPGEGHLIYAVDTPGEMTELVYGGRFYNRAPNSRIVIAHSFDEGKTWTTAWTLTETNPPWDVVHFETIALPSGVRRVLVRYSLSSPAAGGYSGCSIYSVRMTAAYRPADAKFVPLEIAYGWSEWRGDKWVERSHVQRITQPRKRYFISTGGDDLTRTDWIRVRLADESADSQYGYSDGRDEAAKPFVRKRHVWGKNLALGKQYTFSIPSGDNWDGGDPEMTKLTDESIASTYGGGTTYREGPIWPPGKNPAITLDLGSSQTVAAVRIHVTGYPFDLYNGPFSDVEILTSTDGGEFTSRGTITTQMRYRDVDGDFIMPESGRFESWVFAKAFDRPADARYVRYKVSNPKMFFATSEIMAYDSVQVEPWQEPLHLPLDDPSEAERPAGKGARDEKP